MLDFIGFGALNVDYVYEVDDLSNIIVGGRECTAGSEMFCTEEEFVEVKKMLEKHGRLAGRNAGGSAANTAYAMNKMGFRSGYVGKVGKDENGDFLLDSMAGVDISRVARGGVTGMTVVVLDPEGERTIIVLPNCNDDIVFADIDIDYVTDAAFLHMTSFAGENPTDAQNKTAELMRGKTLLSFDPGEISTQKGLVKMMPTLKNSHILFITDREVRLLTGEDYVDGTREIIKYGPEIVVCKQGKIGSYILTHDQEFRVAALEVQAIDKTGAGDVYAAGFLAGMLRNMSLIKCAQAANKAAARSITGWGRENYPDASILDERA
jgi:ribokinase